MAEFNGVPGDKGRGGLGHRLWVKMCPTLGDNIKTHLYDVVERLRLD